MAVCCVKMILNLKHLSTKPLRMHRPRGRREILDRWFNQPIPPKNLNLKFTLSDEMKALFKEPNDKALNLKRQVVLLSKIAGGRSRLASSYDSIRELHCPQEVNIMSINWNWGFSFRKPHLGIPPT